MKFGALSTWSTGQGRLQNDTVVVANLGLVNQHMASQTFARVEKNPTGWDKQTASPSSTHGKGRAKSPDCKAGARLGRAQLLCPKLVLGANMHVTRAKRNARRAPEGNSFAAPIQGLVRQTKVAWLGRQGAHVIVRPSARYPHGQRVILHRAILIDRPRYVPNSLGGG